MFESAIDLDDPGKNAIRRLAGLFRVSAIGTALQGVAFVIGVGRQSPLFAGIYMAFSVFCALGAWVTAAGIESRRPWSRYAALGIAILSLFSLGVGIIFGVIELYSLWRAERSGEFKAGAGGA